MKPKKEVLELLQNDKLRRPIPTCRLSRTQKLTLNISKSDNPLEETIFLNRYLFRQLEQIPRELRIVILCYLFKPADFFPLCKRSGGLNRFCRDHGKYCNRAENWHEETLQHIIVDGKEIMFFTFGEDYLQIEGQTNSLLLYAVKFYFNTS